MLKIIETFSPSPHGHDAVADLHFKIEAMKLAHADRRRYLADPRVVPVPTDELISQRYAVRRAVAINSDKANCDAGFGELASPDTIYLAVVDREGNIASWIQSISGAWGSGVVVDGMGFPLHNRGSGFVLDAQHPNVLAGRKRPSHTIIPAFMEKGGLHIGFGIMGGPNQPTAHMQFAANVIDHSMDIQQALSAPRFTKYSASGCDVMLENRFSPGTLQGLSAKGHLLSIDKEYSLWMGRGQAVLHDSRSKMNYGATSPRADGSAEPEPLP
jgi:gamma-glutamyltranspeptidase/glutathione hydrolase